MAHNASAKIQTTVCTGQALLPTSTGFLLVFSGWPLATGRGVHVQVSTYEKHIPGSGECGDADPSGSPRESGERMVRFPSAGYGLREVRFKRTLPK